MRRDEKEFHFRGEKGEADSIHYYVPESRILALCVFGKVFGAYTYEAHTEHDRNES